MDELTFTRRQAARPPHPRRHHRDGHRVLVRSLVATRGRNTSTAPATAKTGARIGVSAPPQRPAARHRGEEDVP